MTNTFITTLGSVQSRYYALASWSGAAADLVKQNELPMDEVNAHAGIIAVTTCSFDGRGYFDFDADGEPSAVIEVLADDDETTIDLCAWPVDRPEAFATALGTASVLGAARVSNPATWALDGLLHIYRRPLDWLCNGCRGVVILDHRHAPYVLSQALGPMVAEDIQHARDLKAMLCRPPVKPHDILSPIATVRRAA